MSDRAPPRKDTPTVNDAHAWAGAPAPTPTPESAAPASARSHVADVGAVTWCQHMGHDYDAIDPTTLAHLQRAMWEAFVVMWNTAVEHDLTVAAEHVSEDGQPLTRSEPTP